ncbi:MAG: hypothetical protein Q8L54_06160 [Devosia sp.]|nr:hypothetical protein [Devosia sp.]
MRDFVVITEAAPAGSRRAGFTPAFPHLAAAQPTYFGKENEVAGAVVTTWDLSIHRAAIISQQLANGLTARGDAAVDKVGRPEGRQDGGSQITHAGRSE